MKNLDQNLHTGSHRKGSISLTLCFHFNLDKLKPLHTQRLYQSCFPSQFVRSLCARVTGERSYTEHNSRCLEIIFKFCLQRTCAGCENYCSKKKKIKKEAQSSLITYLQFPLVGFHITRVSLLPIGQHLLLASASSRGSAACPCR